MERNLAAQRNKRDTHLIYSLGIEMSFVRIMVSTSQVARKYDIDWNYHLSKTFPCDNGTCTGTGLVIRLIV